jgi:D-alanyl-D-alanine carboxypeptidase
VNSRGEYNNQLQLHIYLLLDKSQDATTRLTSHNNDKFQTTLPIQVFTNKGTLRKFCNVDTDKQREERIQNKLNREKMLCSLTEYKTNLL